MMEFSEGCIIALESGTDGAAEGDMDPGFVALVPVDIVEVSSSVNDLDN